MRGQTSLEGVRELVTHISERLKNGAEHLFGDIDVEGANVELHGTVSRHIGGYVVGGRIRLTVLLRLSKLDDNGNAENTLT